MSIRKFESFNYTLTYHLAGAFREFIIDNKPEDYVMDFIISEDFEAKALKPNKVPMLFDAIESCLDIWTESCTDHYEDEDWEELLTRLNISYEDIIDKKDSDPEDGSFGYEMYDRFREKGQEKLILEVFTMLFNDRLLLMEFHTLLATHVAQLKQNEHSDLLEKDGIVKRCTYWPTWLKDALVHREKGKCAICNKDMTALFSTVDIAKHIDHIVPLNMGGTNDTTNLQILCKEHNLGKGGHTIVTTGNTPLFWEMP